MARNSFGRSGGKDKTILFFFVFMFFIFILVVACAVIMVMNNNNESADISVSSDPNVALRNETVDVLVPIKEIPIGTPLKNQMFEKVSKNVMDVDSRAVKEFELIANMYARAPLIAGMPFLKEQITNIKPSSPVSASIPDGYRAVTIKVDAVSGVEGWAGPGSMVDVYWTSVNKNGNNSISKIVQGAKVLSASGVVNNGEGSSGKVPPSTVTLLVTAEGAQRILLAQTSSGKLSLSLQGPNETGTSDSSDKPISTSDLTGQKQRIIPTTAKRQVQRPSAGTLKISGQEYTIDDRGEIKPIVDDDF